MESGSKIIPHNSGMPLAKNDSIRVYKKVSNLDLELHVLSPPGGGMYPAVVFFFGGGWQTGKVTQFLRHAMHFNRRGMVAILVDYRVESRHQTNPIHAVQDARSAMRYIKSHAEELSVNRHKIVAAGGSAGGHLALCTALADEINDPEDDLSVDPRPIAVVGFNSVCDTSEQGNAFKRFPAESALLASPQHLVTASAPPVLMMHGSADEKVPIEQAKAFRAAMRKVQVPCELIEYAGRGHGFFNDGADFFATLTEMDLFLVSHEIIAPAS
jgi:acetyl esterase/lipase